MGGVETATADERRLWAGPPFPPPEIAPEPANRVAPPSLLSRAGVLSSRNDVLPALVLAFDHELDHGHAFLFVPVFLAAGAALYFAASAEPALTPLLLGLATALLLARAGRAKPLLQVASLAAAMMAAGALAAKIETRRADTAMLGAETSTVLTARVVRIEHQSSGRVRLTLDVLETERPQLRHAPGRVRATARAAPDGVMPGDVVRGAVRLMPASGPVRPMSYDFAFQSYFDGIGAVGFFLSAPQTAQGGWPPASFSVRLGTVIEGWRLLMAHRIETTIGGPEGAIAAALVTGIRAGIPEEINEALRITGLYHVISISGLHMALVAGTLMVALRCGFALAPSLSMRRPVKKYAAAIALAATAFYLLMSGGDVAAQRSFIMLAVMLLAVIVDRAALTLRNLAISAVIILLLAPHEVVGPSFQMSFAATAALVAAYAFWTDRRGKRARSAPSRRSAPASALRGIVRAAAGLSMTSVVAGFATALFTAWHFQQVSPLGLFANLAAMPFVSVIVMPMAVLASLLMPFGLDGPPLQLMGLGIAAMNVIALWLAERSVFDATGAIALPAVFVLTTALAILTLAGSWFRLLAAPLAVAGLGLLLFSDAVPDVLVSEDGRLVAMRSAGGDVAVNRPRPRAFTMENWRRALAAGAIIPPAKAGAVGPLATHANGVFACQPDLCVARHATGALVVHARDAAAAAPFCGLSAVIVVDDATARDICPPETTHVITKRDLARKGSAAITIRPAAGGPPQIDIRFAIAEPYRAWHRHRQFSREARGLAPYRSADGSGPSASARQTGPAHAAATVLVNNAGSARPDAPAP